MKSHVLFLLAFVSAFSISCRQRQTASTTLDNGTVVVDEIGAPKEGKYTTGVNNECGIELSEVVAANGKLSSLVVTTTQKHPSAICMTRSGVKFHYVGCENGSCKKERNPQTGVEYESSFPLKIYKGGSVQISNSLDVGRPGDPPSIVTAHYMYKLVAESSEFSGKMFIYNYAPGGVSLGIETVQFLDGSRMKWTRPVGISGEISTIGTYSVEGKNVVCKFNEDSYGWQLRTLTVEGKNLRLTAKQTQDRGSAVWRDLPLTGNASLDNPLFVSKQ